MDSRPVAEDSVEWDSFQPVIGHTDHGHEHVNGHDHVNEHKHVNENDHVLDP